MSRRVWIGLTVLGVAFVLLAAAAMGGFFLYNNHRIATWRATGEKYYAQQNWSLARSNFRLYLTKHPSDTDILLRFAESSKNVWEGRHAALEEAAHGYHLYLQYKPDDTEVLQKLIDVYVQLGAWLDLQTVTETTLAERAEEPGDPNLRYYRGVAKRALGDTDGARQEFEKLIAEGIERAEPYLELARILRAEDKTEAADKVITDATAARPDDLALRLAAHDYFLEGNEPGRAEKELAEAERIAPNDTRVLLARSREATRKEDIARAIEFAKAAQQADPVSPDVKLALAEAYMRADRMEDAAATLATLDELQRADAPRGASLLADLLYSLGRIEEAHEVREQYMKAHPREQVVADYFEARELLARSQQEGDPRQAQRLATEAAEILTVVVQRRPDLTLFQYYLAMAQRHAGQNEDARATLGTYVRQNPTDDRARRLYEAWFQPPSPDQARTAAMEVMRRETASAQDLVNAARVLINSAESNGVPIPEQQETLRALLEKAIERDPSLPEPYRGLTDLLVASGKAGDAREVLARARAAGVPDEELYRSDANVAIEAGKIEEARALFDKDLARQESTIRTVLDWVDFFQAKRLSDLCGYALERGEERFGESGRLTFQVRRAEVSAVLDEPDAALETIRAVWEGVGEPAPDNPEIEQLQSQLDGARLEVARRLLAENGEGDAETAQRLVADVLARDPENTTGLTLDAQLLLKQTPPKLDEARAKLEQVIERAPGNPAALLGLSMIESAEGDTARALQYAQTAWENAPGSVPAILQLCDLLNDSSDYLRSQSLLAPVVQAQPNNGRALQLYIESLLRGGQTQLAETQLVEFERLASQQPRYATAAAALRARLLLAKNAGGEAVNLLRARYEEAPDDFTVVSNYVNALATLGQLDRAIQTYREFLGRHADHTQAWVELARLYGRKDAGLGDASSALTHALLLEPNNRQALKEMIPLQARRGDVSEALRYCERYLQQEPDDAEVLYQQAAMLASQPSRLQEALRSAQRAVSLSNQPEYLALRGLIYLDLKDYTNALRDLQEVANGPRPTTAEVDLALAELNLVSNNVDSARRYLDSARKKSDEGQRLNARRLEAVVEKLSQKEGTA